MGSQEPSERICPDYHDSDGDDAIRVIQMGGIDLDPWQEDIIHDWMARREDGIWACQNCGGSVPRQNGKSFLVQGRIEAGMLLFNENVIYTAHLQKTSTETFDEMKRFFQTRKISKYVLAIKEAIGREEIILKSGATVKFIARTRNGGRGQHGDLLIFDEAQELNPEAQASFLPAISASANPQTIYTGTPPDENCTGGVFKKLRKNALKHDSDKIAWFEFSVPEIGDVKDVKRWAKTNPALGRRIQLSSIEGEVDSMDEDTFARERLGWWAPEITEDDNKAINAKAWEACKSDELKPEGKTAYGVKFSPDGSMVCLAGAVIPKDGQARISLIQIEPTGHGIRWLSDWLNERYKKASCVVIDGRNGVDVLVDRIHDTWKYKDSVIRPRVKDVLAAVSLLTEAVNEQDLTWYSKQPALNESAVSSVKRPLAGGWCFGGDNSLPIEACALALWGAKTSKRDPLRKMRVG